MVTSEIEAIATQYLPKEGVIKSLFQLNKNLEGEFLVRSFQIGEPVHQMIYNEQSKKWFYAIGPLMEEGNTPTEAATKIKAYQ